MPLGAAHRFVDGESPANLGVGGDGRLNSLDMGGNVSQQEGPGNELNVQVSAMQILDLTGPTPTAVVFPAVASQPVVDATVNYLFLVAGPAPAVPTLTINQSGFPDPAVTEHIPLAQVQAAGAVITSFTDKRPRVTLGVGRLASYSVANLPVRVTGFAHAFATDARKTGEGGGSGTGIMAVFDVASGWRDANGAALLT